MQALFGDVRAHVGDVQALVEGRGSFPLEVSFYHLTAEPTFALI